MAHGQPSAAGQTWARPEIGVLILQCLTRIARQKILAKEIAAWQNDRN
jgi:hypothetical protein